MLAFRSLSFILCQLISVFASAQPILKHIQQANPDQRVRLLMNFADTAKLVSTDQVAAFRLLDAIDELGKQQRDDQLRRYCRFEKDIYATHTAIGDSAKASLFLLVGQQAIQRGDGKIAAICQHFAGRSYFTKGDYGKAFEHMLAANKAFREIGLRHFPEISRYLYELAFSYYHFREYEKAISLLTQATRFPVYNENLAIQTYNTLGLSYIPLSQITESKPLVSLAEKSYQKARQRAYT